MKGFNKIKNKINKAYPTLVVEQERGCIKLSGVLEQWTDVVAAGRMAVCKHSLGVLNEVTVKGIQSTTYLPPIQDNSLEGKQVDVLVIGGGVVGCAVARELTRYNLTITLIEKESDVALAQSGRNDGQIHVGMDLSSSTLKCRYLARSNPMFEQLSKELDFPFRRVPQYVVFPKYFYLVGLPMLKARGRKNGITPVKYLSARALFNAQPNVTRKAKFALRFDNAGLVCPYGMTIAYADNAVSNGAEFYLNTAATGMSVSDGKITYVQTNRGKIYPKVVINCAGVYSDEIARMASDCTFTIHPRRGTNAILDKLSQSKLTDSIISLYGNSSAEDKKNHTKGGGVMSTVDGNILVGPDAAETPLREDITTTGQSISGTVTKHSRVMPSLATSDVITYFTGVRASTYEEDFVIRKGIFTQNIVEVAGIQSPGLSAAPALAEDAAKFALQLLGGAEVNTSFNPIRKGVNQLNKMTAEQKDALIASNPDYGEIVCRCENVSKGEILDALRLPLKVYSIDAVKRRVRCGMGRCQGGFCQPLVLGIIAQEQGIPKEQVIKKGMATVITGLNKK